MKDSPNRCREIEQGTEAPCDALWLSGCRFPGSSRGAPTKLFNSLGVCHGRHSDRRVMAIPTNRLSLYFSSRRFFVPEISCFRVRFA
jgi:hypothetical protein